MLQKILIILQMGVFLLFLMWGNISLGKNIAQLKAEYNRATFFNGLSKAVNIGFFILGLYIFGQLPLFQAFTINNPLGDGFVTIEQCLNVIMWGAIGTYATLDFIKLIKLLRASTAAKETEEVTEDTTPIDDNLNANINDTDEPITPTEEELKQTEAGA